MHVMYIISLCNYTYSNSHKFTHTQIHYFLVHVDESTSEMAQIERTATVTYLVPETASE